MRYVEHVIEVKGLTLRGLFRRRNKVACPKCGASVDAERLAERQAEYRRSAVAFGIPADMPPLDSAVIEVGWWGFKGHTVACGVCDTGRRSDW